MLKSGIASRSFHSMDIQNRSNDLSNKIQEILDSMTVNKTVTDSNVSNKWFNSNLYDLNQKKIRSYNIVVWSNSIADWALY